MKITSHPAAFSLWGRRLEMNERAQDAQVWAQRIRRLEATAMAWIYESETNEIADRARRTLAQAVGLRRLLDQLSGRVSAHREDANHEIVES